MARGETDAIAGQVGPLGAGGVIARPELFGRLARPTRVTVVAAPAGSGKTVLLRSWIGQANLSGRAAWVAPGQDERDPQHFWLAVRGALHRTFPGSVPVQALTAAPDLDGWAIVERLLADLAPLRNEVWLVIDDAHELGPEVLGQLELLIMRAPPRLRFVLATRHDLRLGLHRLRLKGELQEIRADDLRFSLTEARELFAAAGVAVTESVVARLHQRTEGWAAGLRLAALSLAGHPDPERFAAEFSGTKRTVAEYLLDQVLDRQGERVRRLLLRTSILERVNGELAYLLTGEDGAERVLQDLERANAFVFSLDAERTWFRYHQMFADLLRLELPRAAPGNVAGLDQAAAGWFAGHGFPVEAIRHAQAARDWELAARLLTDHWPGLYLDGHTATVHELLSQFPAGSTAADSGLAVLAAADELAHGSPESAERYLALAEQESASVPAGRRGQYQALLGIVRLLHARQRANPGAAADGARRLQAAAEALEAAQPHLDEDLRALALISLGTTEIWTTQPGQARGHLKRGVALARRIGRPFLEFTGLANLAVAETMRPFAQMAETGRTSARVAEFVEQATELAERHGWTGEPAFGIACRALGAVLVWQGRLDEAEPWIEHAERTVAAEAEPAAAVAVYNTRGILERARGGDAAALAAYRAAERLGERLGPPNLVVLRAQALQLFPLARLGDTKGAEQILDSLTRRDRERGDVRIGTAAVLLTQGNPRAAATALAPVLDGSASEVPWLWLSLAFLLDASARDALGDQEAASRALEDALDIAEPDGWLLPFLLHPAQDLLQRQLRWHTAHASLIAEILVLLAGNKPAPPGAELRQPAEPLSESEVRVLRYLPTNLTTPEIADQLSVSVSTVKTQVRELNLKLGTHGRAEAVNRARHLGLLAPSARGAR